MVKDASNLPSQEELVAFIQSNPDQGAVRHVAKAFGLRGEKRAWLKAELKILAAKGLISKKGKTLAPPEALPPVGVLLIFDQNEDGDLLALYRDQADPNQEILVLPGKFAPKLGDRILARLERKEVGSYVARPIKILEKRETQLVLGLLRAGRLVPTDRRIKREFLIKDWQERGLDEGELLLAKPVNTSRQADRFGLQEAEVMERFGRGDTVAGACQVALQTHEIRQVFPDRALAEADTATGPSIAGREDLRSLGLVTIDGETARDFDDAVYAEPLNDGQGNQQGWRILVAIADVSSYVLPGSALDQEAWQRGNSVYLPDRCVPMLPEALSNHWCSLVPGQDRACLAVWVSIDLKGKLGKVRFVRGLMRSHARLTYEQVQAYADQQACENPDFHQPLAPTSNPQLCQHIEHLFAAFTCLSHARNKRGTLDLEVPEYEIELNENQDQVVRIFPRPRLDAHKLIEEFMILANVAAAKTLEKRGHPLIYRIHEPPSLAKLEALNVILKALDLTPLKQNAGPQSYALLLDQAERKGMSALLGPLVLRSLSQAAYSPDNTGHFGLALASYAHFTSPIRRYADLVVHRALVAALGLSINVKKQDGLQPQEVERLEETAEHISQCERKATLAERDAKDRLLADFMTNRIGSLFTADIVSVTKFGLFVQVLETGAQGLLPFEGLPDDRYAFDEEAGQLIGQRWGQVFTLGDRLKVQLSEAEADVARLTFTYADRVTRAKKALNGGRQGRRAYSGSAKRQRSKGGKGRKSR